MATNILIFFSFILVSITTFGQEIRGIIVDNQTGEPLPYAKVKLPDIHLATLSDSVGKFQIHNVPNASIKMSVHLFNYEQTLITLNPAKFKDVEIRLNPIHHVFDEVIITKSEGKLQKETITSVEYRSNEELFATGASTLGEALVNIPGVQQNTIGTGISRPVVRGLSGMRIVTYWDGLRIENQQWGEDHGMATSEIGMSGVEIVKGPATLIYGSDAIGGVVHMQDKSFVEEKTQKIAVSTKFESNTLGTANELGYQINTGKVRFNTFANYQNHSDFQLPNGKFLRSSRFWVANSKSAFNFRKNNYVFTARHHFNRSQIGIPGHTHDVIPSADDFLSSIRGLRSSTPPSQFITNNFISIEQRLLLKKNQLYLQLGNTNNHLREFDHGFDVPFTNLNLNNSLYNLRLNHFLTEKINLKIGSQGMYQINRNSLPANSFLIPDADAFDIGVYALADFETKKWRFQIGGRFDRRQITSYKPNADSSIISNIDSTPINRIYQTANFSAGMVYNSKKSTFRVNLSSGFRAPHLAELLANGVHHGSFRYEKGDRDLVSEQAMQLDVTYELHTDHFEFILNPYINIINNFIYLERTDSIVANQVGSFDYFEFKQLNRALLYGGEVGVHYHPHQLHRLHLESNFSLTLGEDLDGNFINLIPQPLLNSRIRFDIKNNHKIQIKHIILEHQNFMTQNRVSEFERPTKSFHLINIATELSLSDYENIRFSFGVRNLLNTEYVAHLSPLKNLGEGVPQPGINIFGKLTLNFSKK